MGVRATPWHMFPPPDTPQAATPEHFWISGGAVVEAGEGGWGHTRGTGGYKTDLMDEVTESALSDWDRFRVSTAVGVWLR